MSIRRDQIACAVVAISVAGSGAMLTMTGCTGLDYSAHAEGTGIQIVGAIVVLAKYHASERQKAFAEEQARKLLLQVAKPHYERRRAAVQDVTKKKIAALEGDYDRRIANALTTSPAAAAELDAEKKRVQARLNTERDAQLASLQHEMDRMAGAPSRGLKMNPAPAIPAGDVPLASMHDRETLAASAAAHLPRYVARSVPPLGIPAEQGGKSYVMIWDNGLQKLASENVYVLDRAPRDGADFKVEGWTARFASNK